MEVSDAKHRIEKPKRQGLEWGLWLAVVGAVAALIPFVLTLLGLSAWHIALLTLIGSLIAPYLVSLVVLLLRYLIFVGQRLRNYEPLYADWRDLLEYREKAKQAILLLIDVTEGKNRLELTMVNVFEVMYSSGSGRNVG